MTGFVINSLVPVRKDAAHRSEMISQFLFGEIVDIKEDAGEWLYVKNYTDGYLGWIDKKMIYILNDQEFKYINAIQWQAVTKSILTCKCNSGIIHLPGGSLFPNGKDFVLNLGNYSFQLENPSFNTGQIDGNLIVKLAKQFLNSPYLWGGKSILGIDCSGLTQVVYSMAAIQLPRDAYQQVESGKVINSLDEVCEGDLAFFKNESGRVVHVGIIIDQQTIIHASGCVKIDFMDKDGIKNNAGVYTHHLHAIRRII